MVGYDGRIQVGSIFEQAGFDKRLTMSGLDRLIDAAQEMVPEIGQCTVTEMWAGLRPGTPDEQPILGATALPGYLLATGLFRNGLLLAPVVARETAQLAATGRASPLIAPFSIDRFTSSNAATGEPRGS